MASDIYPQITVLGSHRYSIYTGSLSTVAAATGTAGHIGALRNPSTSVAVRLRRLEMEYQLSTAFGAAQEVAAGASILRSYTAGHTGGNAITMTGGRAKASQPATVLTGRISDTAALTAGTHTFDANWLCRTTNTSNAVASGLAKREFDFKDWPLGGVILGQDEGIVLFNIVLMGATGVVKWFFSFEFDDLLIA